MKNLNPNFNGTYLPDRDLFAYIDETGDEGLNSTNDWFGVSAIVSTQRNLQQMVEETEKFFKEKNIPNIKSFKKINHNQRRNLFAKLQRFNYLTIHSFFSKRDLSVEDKLLCYPSMYFVGLKNVIERLSWLTKQLNKNRCHILISGRNHINFENLSDYLFNVSTRTSVSGRNMYYSEKIGIVGTSQPQKHPKLYLSDYVASSMFECLQTTTDLNLVEECYARILLKGKLYSSNHVQYEGVWRNGLKLTPDNESLIQYEGILEEGSQSL